MPYANNKGADQPAHPHSLISTFVVCCLDSIISLASIFANSWLAFCSWAGRFESYLVANPQRQVFSWCGPYCIRSDFYPGVPNLSLRDCRSWNDFYNSFFPVADSSLAVVSNRRRYVHLVMINCLGGLRLPRNSFELDNWQCSTWP